MIFNFEKCKCLLAGHGNTGVTYEMGGTIPCKNVKERTIFFEKPNEHLEMDILL